jgi:stage IV sporulation protein FB
MPDRAAWSLSLGDWCGVHVRLHVFFVLFAACAFLLQWQIANPIADLDWIIPASLLILFVSVLVHEVGHVWSARRYDGIADLIVVGPLGGMVPVHVTGNARAELRTHLAGPLSNLLVCVFCAAVLLMMGTHIWGLLNPVSPWDLATGSTTEVLLKLAFWVNWALLWINLVPAFPLDGAFVLRSAILDRWPRVSPAGASLIVARTGQVLACLLALGALFWRIDEDQLILPIRISLLVFAILLFFAARQHRWLDAGDTVENLLLGYELTGDLQALEQELEETDGSRAGPLGRWLNARRQARQRRQRDSEIEDEQRVDEILSRLHERGMQALSDEDLAILQRVSHRYRTRTER